MQLALKTSNMGVYMKTMTLRRYFWLIPNSGSLGRIAYTILSRGSGMNPDKGMTPSKVSWRQIEV